MKPHARFALLAGMLTLGAWPSSTLGQSPQELLQEGRRALQANDFKRAQQTFAELIKKDPSATTYAYLAVAELSTGDTAQAIAHFERARQLGNDSANMHYYWGLALLQHKEPNSGIRELREALSKDPELFQADTALGIALVNAGRPKEAVPYLEQARAHSPSDAEIRANLVRAEFEAGETATALAGIDAAVDAIPETLASTPH